MILPCDQLEYMDSSELLIKQFNKATLSTLFRNLNSIPQTAQAVDLKKDKFVSVIHIIMFIFSDSHRTRKLYTCERYKIKFVCSISCIQVTDLTALEN